MTVDVLSLLDSGNYQTYNRSVARALGSVNAAIMLSELINRYHYHKDTGSLITYQKYEGSWFYYTVEKCTERTVLSKKEQESAIKILEKNKLFTKTSIGLPARRHFQLNFTAIHSFVQNSNSFSSSPKKGQLGATKRDSQEAQKGTANKEPYKEPKEDPNIKKVNEGASPQSMPSFKKKVENPRDFLKSKEELELFDRLAKFAPQKGEKLLPKEISWWIKEFGIERVKEALTVYLQQVDRATQGKGNAVIPENAGKYIRNVLNNPTIKPCDENQKANKAFAEDLSKKHPFLSVLEKYVTLPLGIGDLYYTFPHEHFKNLLRQKVETYKQNYC